MYGELIGYWWSLRIYSERQTLRNSILNNLNVRGRVTNATRLVILVIRVIRGVKPSVLALGNANNPSGLYNPHQ